MNLLKQTALILGLTSLSIGSWTLYQNWQNRISILFSTFCMLVSVWALSFVSHATLVGRLSHDIHLFCNVWLSPVVILILAKILLKRVDLFSQVLQVISFIGALILSCIISFSIPRTPIMSLLINFWPALVLIEFLYIVIQDFFFDVALNTDYISPSKKIIFYIGLGLSLIFCSFDRIPFLGFTIPAMANLLFTIYLIFASQVITPQKILGLEALVSRFFATVILALVITGFFALLYNYISETFPLFLLNSFFISFAVLMLWNPLVTFFRYLAKKIGRQESEFEIQKLNELRLSISVATDLEKLQELISDSFKWVKGAKAQLVYDPKGLKLHPRVVEYLEYLIQKKIAPILYREFIQMEREQVLSQNRMQTLDLMIKFLDQYQTDLIFPVFYSKQVVALVLVQTEATLEEWNLNVGLYSKIYDTLQELGPTLIRLTQIKEQKETDRLVLMGEMAAGLAHEVRNPLGAIRGAAELMGQDSGPWGKVIQEEVGRLNRLVSQFLDFAHDPKDQQEILDLNELLGTALRNIKINHLNVSAIEFQGSASPVWVKVVPDHLQQVLLNLVQNAEKAVEGLKESKIIVRVFNCGFEVTDNGVGMSAEVLDKVFQPFFTSFKNGTGLGLSICQRLIHFNQGKISISSHLKKGTTVSISFVESKKVSGS